MAKKPTVPKVIGKGEVTLCAIQSGTKARINAYAEKLRRAAPTIGDHGLSKEAFAATGLFEAAIERLRGQKSAAMGPKRSFLSAILNYLQRDGSIRDWQFTGSGERHDYQVTLADGRISVFEAKGCLDGNNAQIFQRPPNADEFAIWSLCQNAGADPRHNAWSGIHTRLTTKIIAEKAQVDGLVVWDMLCGTLGRPCPKVARDPSRLVSVSVDLSVPPPCLYLFPRTLPDPRNNKKPAVWKLSENGLLSALAKSFKCDIQDLTQVSIEARMNDADVERKTTLLRDGKIVGESRWTAVKQAKR